MSRFVQCSRFLPLTPAALFLRPRSSQCEEKPGQNHPPPPPPRSLDEYIMSSAPRWRREWNHDWDGRHRPDEETNYDGKVRHILLIRHGQYDLKHADHGLTALGMEQSKVTGNRLAASAAGIQKDIYGTIKIKYSALVSSPILRAKQTGDIISEVLHDVPRVEDPLLAEGFPCVPIPQGKAFLKDGRVLPSEILEEGPRIEAAFRKYIHRDVDHKAEKKTEELGDSYAPAASATSGSPISPEAAAGALLTHEYIVLVCHMNVIRYFVSRALQLPPETWLRMRGYNCGITELVIQPNGAVSLGSFGDIGHLAIEQVTFH